jgi:hypothetical protein
MNSGKEQGNWRSVFMGSKVIFSSVKRLYLFFKSKHLYAYLQPKSSFCLKKRHLESIKMLELTMHTNCKTCNKSCTESFTFSNIMQVKCPKFANTLSELGQLSWRIFNIGNEWIKMNNLRPYIYLCSLLRLPVAAPHRERGDYWDFKLFSIVS